MPSAKRLDIIEVVVEAGADPGAMPMTDVFDTWQPEIMEYFVEHGADVETGNPLAYAFCERIRTALRIFKKYKDRFASFQEQANIALRHHCAEGNLKWISLMLWAGADPNVPGPADYDEEPDPEEDVCALEQAAISGHFEVFKLKNVRVDPTAPFAPTILRCACSAKTNELLERLLKLGFKINDQENGGSSLFTHILEQMSWPFTHYYCRSERNNDTEESRQKMKMIHIIAKCGGKWIPQERWEVGNCRRSLLRMTPDYTAEFTWIMSKYQACTQEPVKRLLRTSTIRAHVRELTKRIEELVETLPENLG
jgi:hypothetical protein